MQRIMVKTAESDAWGSASEQQLLDLFAQQGYTARHVVITGGEPSIYDLQPLTSLLEQAGFSCQIETSGTHEVRCSAQTWVTVSPKVNMRGGLKYCHRHSSVRMKLSIRLAGYEISKH